MNTPKYHELIEGTMPPRVRRLIKQAGRTVNKFSMVQSGDRVLLGISGGKDSLVLALALSLRRKWLPVTYELQGVMINWKEHPADPHMIEQLHAYFSSLDIPLKVIDAEMFSPSFQGEFNCYLCSRNRRRILFQEAADQGISLVAMGHHIDDLVETTLINLCFRSDFSTMLPVQEFFSGKLHIIRPLIEIREHAVNRLAEEYELPVCKPVCPYDKTNIRSRLKPVIRDLARIDKLTREHVFNAHQFSCRIPRYESEDHRSSREHGAQEKGKPSA